MRKGLLLVDPALYIIIPLISEGKSEQLAVWETIHSTNKQYKVHLLTLTNWSKPTPHLITPTSPGAAADSIESEARVTGVGGHSVHWSVVSGSTTIVNVPICW